MSKPGREHEVPGPLRYAPKWARDYPAEQPRPLTDQSRQLRPAATQKPAPRPPSEPAHRAGRQTPPRPPKPQSDRFEGDVAISELRTQLALAPDQIPEPSLREPRPSVFGVMTRFAGLIAVAAACALGFVWISAPRAPSSDPAFTLASYEGPGAGTPAVKSVSLATVTSRDASAPRATDATAWSPADRGGDVGGREAGGRDVGGREAGESVGAASFVGRAAAMTSMPAVTDRRASPPDAAGRIAAMPPASAAAAPMALPAATTPPAAAPGRSAVPAAPIPDRSEVAMLVARGRQYIADGDVVTARLVFRRAAESGDAEAALALGGTYDPIMLKRLGVVSFAADPAKARSWYQKAAALGAADASARIQQLER